MFFFSTDKLYKCFWRPQVCDPCVINWKLEFYANTNHQLLLPEREVGLQAGGFLLAGGVIRSVSSIISE